MLSSCTSILKLSIALAYFPSMRNCLPLKKNWSISYWALALIAHKSSTNDNVHFFIVSIFDSFLIDIGYKFTSFIVPYYLFFVPELFELIHSGDGSARIMRSMSLDLRFIYWVGRLAFLFNGLGSEAAISALCLLVSFEALVWKRCSAAASAP